MNRPIFTLMIVFMLASITGCSSEFFNPYLAERNRRIDYINSHPEIGARVAGLIRNGRVAIGMTDEQILASWGRPNDINRTANFRGVYEQWVYGYDYESMRYLYLEHGVLTSWSE